MTDREAIKLAKRVEYWQKKMPLLGIAHWKIERVTTCDEMPDEGSLAQVQCSEKYDSCRFWFWNDYLDRATPDDLDQTIIHEWVHVAMRDFDVALQAVEPWMPEATYEDFSYSTNLRREALVDRLARQLYDAYRE